MKFTCIRSDLANAISNVQRAVSSKASIPALEGILIKAYNNKLILTGYDLEIGITTTMEGTVKNEGEIIVSAKLFNDIVRKLPEEIICFETDDRFMVYITSGQADYQIVGMQSSEYPELPTFKETDKLSINSEILKNMIRQTIYAVSDNIAKPIYTGALFDIENKIFKIVGIDGFRMAIREENIDSEIKSKFVVPKKTLSEILKLISDNEKDVDIIVGQRHIIFNIENYSIISRLIEGNFLDYKSTLPKEEKTHLIIKTDILANSVDRIALLTDEKIQSPIRCSISENEIKLSCSSTRGKANDSISVNVAGDDVEIGFNNRYLLDALKNTEMDEVKIILNGSLSPMIIKPIEGNNFIFLVVPMRLSSEK